MVTDMKIYLGSDHSGYQLKEKIKLWLEEWGYEFEDFGTNSQESADYPDFIFPVAKAVARNGNSRGIILGGSGQGEAMCANRVKGARAAVFYGPRKAVHAVDVTGRKSTDPLEILNLSRKHNNANILSLGTRFLDEKTAKQAVKYWLEAEFSGDERHIRRIKKLDV